jgi:hypothetical protein
MRGENEQIYTYPELGNAVLPFGKNLVIAFLVLSSIGITSIVLKFTEYYLFSAMRYVFRVQISEIEVYLIFLPVLILLLFVRKIKHLGQLGMVVIASMVVLFIIAIVIWIQYYNFFSDVSIHTTTNDGFPLNNVLCFAISLFGFQSMILPVHKELVQENQIRTAIFGAGAVLLGLKVSFAVFSILALDFHGGDFLFTPMARQNFLQTTESVVIIFTIGQVFSVQTINFPAVVAIQELFNLPQNPDRPQGLARHEFIGALILAISWILAIFSKDFVLHLQISNLLFFFPSLIFPPLFALLISYKENGSMLKIDFKFIIDAIALIFGFYAIYIVAFSFFSH